MDEPRIRTKKGELSDEEAYLAAILMDRSGIDIAEFLWDDAANDDGCYRVYPVQWSWWRDESDRQINQASRSVGKSESINVSAHAFPFSYPGEEMVIIGPESSHVDAIADRIERRLLGSRLMREMLVRGRTGITHRPFKVLFSNGARIMSRLPQRDGKGIKGIHPVILEVDECFPAGTLVLTKRGQIPIEDVVVGDDVVTHKNRWKKVTNTFQRERETVKIETAGHAGLVASRHHPFWGMMRTDTYGLQMSIEEDGRNVRMTHSRNMDPPNWIHAEDLEGCYVSTPTCFPKGRVPSFIGIGEKRGNAKIPCDENAEGFMWVVGLWIAEGSFWNHKVTWSVHVDEVDEVVERMDALGLHPWVQDVQNTKMCKNIIVSSTLLGKWLHRYFGDGAHEKTIPAWALGISKEKRQELFDGVIYGDGCYVENDWKLTTVSKKLATSFRLLASSLGFSPRVYWNDTSNHVTEIRGRRVRSKGFYQVVANKDRHSKAYTYRRNLYQRVEDVNATGKVETLYDITVEDDHSFIADGLIVSNSQDITEQAWREMPEVVRWEIPGARWRCHGVSKGLRDSFYAKTQPGSGFKVHRITAMSRPRWTPEDRAQRVKEYGSDFSPDFKRNVYGLHGDAMNRIFLQHVLMRGQVRRDDNAEHPYLDEYHHRTITAGDVARQAGDIDIALCTDEHVEAIRNIMQLPEEHLANYKTFWVGVDLGLVADPSELLVFAEYNVGKSEARADRNRQLAVPKDGETRIKLLTRLSIREVPAPLQADLITMVIDHYKPVALGLDANGNGMPIYQELQKRAGVSRFEIVDADDEARAALTTIRNYNFGAKLYAGIDEKRVEELGLVDPQEILAKAGIKRWTKDWATDVLRDEWVNKGRFMFPDDDELLNDFNGQTWQSSKDPVDAYGNQRRVYGGVGGFHILDAARFAALAWRQGKIEAFESKKPVQVPIVVTSF